MLLICLQKLGGGYEGKASLFDKIEADDVIIAFFPCVRFEAQIILWMRGVNYSQRKWDLEEKMKTNIDLVMDMAKMNELVNQLFIVCLRKGLKLVMENPYSEQHFLRRYWCFEPAIIDKDRRESGDYFAKPTQYWFLNFEPKQNLIFEPITYNHLGTGGKIDSLTKEHCEKVGAESVKTLRSMIHPDYANRFIRQYIL